MLGKLLKYEIPALGRKLVPLYIGWGLTAILLGLAVGPLEAKSEFMVVISGMLYTAAATAVLVMAVVMIIQRYSNSLLGDQAYFNQVLPVTSSEHIASKGIAALIWILLSGVAMIITALIIFAFSGAILHMFEIEWAEFWKNIITNITGRSVLIFIEVVLLAAFSIVKSVLAIYTAITVGHQAQRHTTLASIGAYIGTLVFESFVTRVLYVFIPDLMKNVDGFKDFQIVFLVGVIITAAIGAVYFFICRYLMENKLNLA